MRARAPVADAEDERVLRPFRRAGENALEVARLVDQRFREHPNSGITQEQVKAAETDNDSVTRDLIQLLNTQYLTPFDRDDIYMLAIEIDDVVDELEEASDLLGLYGVELPTRHAVQQTALIVAAAEQLPIACDDLKSFRASSRRRRAQAARGRGRPGQPRRARRPFRDDRIDPLIVIRWKDIYDRWSARSTAARRRRTRSPTSSSRTPDGSLQSAEPAASVGHLTPDAARGVRVDGADALALVVVALSSTSPTGSTTPRTIATSVSTRALCPGRPSAALGAQLRGRVRLGRGRGDDRQGIVDQEAITLDIVLAGLVGAITWNLSPGSGLPSSSSHALIGG